MTSNTIQVHIDLEGVTDQVRDYQRLVNRHKEELYGLMAMYGLKIDISAEKDVHCVH